LGLLNGVLGAIKGILGSVDGILGSVDGVLGLVKGLLDFVGNLMLTACLPSPRLPSPRDTDGSDHVLSDQTQAVMARVDARQIYSVRRQDPCEIPFGFRLRSRTAA
jgi:hypothetical protein